MVNVKRSESERISHIINELENTHIYTQAS